MSPAEKKVAALVSADPARIVGGTLAAVAKAAGVSEPTVIRFCRSIGLEGFSDLRLALARAEGEGRPGPVIRVGPGTPLAEVPGAALDAAIAALAALRRGIDPSGIERAARLLLDAMLVEVWGTGDAAPVAKAIGQRLLGLCRNLSVRTDPRMQAMVAAGLEAGAVVVQLSGSPVLAAGVRVVSLAGSPPAEALVLSHAAPPESGLAQPMAQRLMLLALGEALALAVSLLAPPAARDRAARMAAAARDERPGWQGAAGPV